MSDFRLDFLLLLVIIGIPAIAVRIPFPRTTLDLRSFFCLSTILIGIVLVELFGKQYWHLFLFGFLVKCSQTRSFSRQISLLARSVSFSTQTEHTFLAFKVQTFSFSCTL